jgi:hypothetical protein
VNGGTQRCCCAADRLGDTLTPRPAGADSTGTRAVTVGAGLEFARGEEDGGTEGVPVGVVAGSGAVTASTMDEAAGGDEVVTTDAPARAAADDESIEPASIEPMTSATPPSTRRPRHG